MSGFAADASGLDGVLTHLRELGDQARQRLAAAVENEARALAAYVQSDKLSGQVLNRPGESHFESC